MTNEEYRQMREEMSRVFIINLHQGVEFASECSIAWLYNKVVTEAADIAKDWDISIVQPETLSRAMAEEVCRTIGPAIAEAIMKRRIQSAEPDTGDRGHGTGVPAVHTGNRVDSAKSEQINDGRPEGWTEARCLMYIGTEDADDADVLANLFIHGDWYEIQQTFPLFVKWMNERSN